MPKEDGLFTSTTTNSTVDLTEFLRVADFIKYNLYLMAEAQVASAIIAADPTKSLSKVAAEANFLMKKMHELNQESKEQEK